ncbi:hypothetical protein ACQ7HM_14340 [Williamsia sp. MIQD14]|uniref:hypothetical protein n=1 Tax=Williamsia sp. MIQD14 TaxID=3425703 RepID=UPI003DA09004
MTDGQVTFSTEAAEQLQSAAGALQEAVDQLRLISSGLEQVMGCGNFPSGSAIQAALVALGKIAVEAMQRLYSVLQEIDQSVKAAGNIIDGQEEESAAAIRNPKPSGSPPPDLSGIMTGGAPSSSSGTTSVPGIGPLINGLVNGTVHQQQSPLGVSGGLPGLLAAPPEAPKSPGADAAGKFQTNAAPEASGALTLDAILSALNPSDAAALVRLAEQWQQVADSLNTAIAGFNGVFQKLLGGPTWNGYLADTMRGKLTEFTTNVQGIADQSHANSGAINVWATGLGNSKSAIQQLEGGRATAWARHPRRRSSRYSKVTTRPPGWPSTAPTTPL